MDIAEAIPIIRSLAEGLHPVTKQALAEKSVCRLPQAVKALNRALGALIAQQERATKSPGNAFKTWSRAEDAQVCEALRAGKDFVEIAKAHNRTVPAIVARLVKLGKITPGKAAKDGPLFPEKVA